MELIKSLRWRYATKKMTGEQVPQDKLDRILESIRLAPSSYGLTPYRVIVVKSQEVKEKLLPACYGQTQITDSSEVLVFAVQDDISEELVDKYISRIALERNTPTEALSDFGGMIKGSISNLSYEQKLTWAQKQCYIALGVGLVSAAYEQVDSTPMEGFNPTIVDEVLGLNDLNLKSTVILTLGYRDTENDYLYKLQKVRMTTDELFIRK